MCSTQNMLLAEQNWSSTEEVLFLFSLLLHPFGACLSYLAEGRFPRTVEVLKRDILIIMSDLGGFPSGTAFHPFIPVWLNHLTWFSCCCFPKWLHLPPRSPHDLTCKLRFSALSWEPALSLPLLLKTKTLPVFASFRECPVALPFPLLNLSSSLTLLILIIWKMNYQNV